MSNDFTHDVPEDEQPFVDYRPANRRFPFARGIRRNAGVYWMNESEPETPAIPMTAVRILAEYDLYGSIETEAWELAHLDGAIESHLIKHYQILLVQTGPFGLRHVSFFVDADVPAGNTPAIKRHALMVLEEIVREPDVRVRYVSQI